MAFKFPAFGEVVGEGFASGGEQRGIFTKIPGHVEPAMGGACLFPTDGEIVPERIRGGETALCGGESCQIKRCIECAVHEGAKRIDGRIGGRRRGNGGAVPNKDVVQPAGAPAGVGQRKPCPEQAAAAGERECIGAVGRG